MKTIMTKMTQIYEKKQEKHLGKTHTHNTNNMFKKEKNRMETN